MSIGSAAPSNQEPPLTDVFYYSLPTLRAEGGRPRGYLPGAEGGIQGLHHLGFVHALLTCRHTIIQVLLYVHPVFRIQIGLALGSFFFPQGSEPDPYFGSAISGTIIFPLRNIIYISCHVKMYTNTLPPYPPCTNLCRFGNELLPREAGAVEGLLRRTALQQRVHVGYPTSRSP